MKIGLSLNTHGGAYGETVPDRDAYPDFLERLIAQAVAAEAGGFDGLFVAERHARHETFFPQPLALLGILATHTERIELATHVLILSLYNPAQIAEQAALVDLASRGRLIFGVAMGYNDAYDAAYGVGRVPRRTRFEEGLDVLELAWRGETFDYHGDAYEFDGALILPRPYRKPRPKLWIGGQAEKAVRRAARRGDGWPLAWPLAEEQWRRLRAIYREESAAQGRRGEICITRHTWVGADRKAVEEKYAPLWLADLKYYFDRGQLVHPDFSSAADFTIENARKALIMGTPEEAVEKILAYADDDVDYLKISMRLPLGPSMDEADEVIQILAEEVLPKVRAELGTAPVGAPATAGSAVAAD